MRLSRFIATASLLVFLASCGFKPLYGDFGDSVGDRNLLASVEVTRIDGQPGGERMRAQLANDLRDLHGFESGEGAGSYGLEIDLDEVFTPMGIRPDGAATREQYRLSANFVLKDNISDEIIQSGTLSARNTYDVVLSDFSNFSARSDAARRGAREIARALAIRISTVLASPSAIGTDRGGQP